MTSPVVETNADGLTYFWLKRKQETLLWVETNADDLSFWVETKADELTFC